MRQAGANRTSGKQNPRQTLLGASKAFLAEAIKNHRDRKDAFAILHAVIAVELALKARLARINPALVCESIDKRPPDRRSVGLSAIPGRLENLSVPLADGDADMVRRFANWRNDVVHHLPTYDEHEARQQLPQLLDFLVKFLRDDLGVSLRSALPRELYSSANKLLTQWASVVAEAAARAEAEGGVLSEPCPVCGASGVMSGRGKKPAHCHLCESDRYRLDHCIQCGASTMVEFSSSAFHLCKGCIDDAGDAWLSLHE